MATQVMVELEHLRILWDDELEAVHMQWLAPVGGEELRNGLDRGIGLLVLKGAKRWLADLKWRGVVAKADEAWINDDWFARALAGGLRWLAIVNPESSVSTFSVRELMESKETQLLVETDQLVTHSFENVMDARGWLAECDESD